MQLMHSRKRKRPKGATPEFAGRYIGYARVSTPEQDVAMQIQALRRAGVHEDNLWSETVSGVKKVRKQLELALLDARKGDIFVVWKLDRLGRSVRDLIEKTEFLEKHGVGFRSITEGIDTTTPVGRLLFHVIAALAQFERDLVVERTTAGMAAVKERGGMVGAPLIMTPEKVKEASDMFRAGKDTHQVAKHFGVSRQTIYVRFNRAKIKKLQGKLRRARNRKL